MDIYPVLAVTRSLKDIPLPTKSSSRLNYQCISVLQNFICLGASTGSNYVFDRHSGKLIKFISNNKVSPIILLRCSHDEKLIAAVDSSGFITCWQVDSREQEFKIAKEIEELQSHTITALCWSDSSHRLFVGTKNGLVMSFGIGFSGFGKASSETIRKSGDPVVQMDFNNERLVISSTSKVIICYTDKSQFHQIGTKARDGHYGACFMNNVLDNQPMIYSARPGSRLWEVDFNGQVLLTHQFKELLAIPPTKIICSRGTNVLPSDPSIKQSQSFNFPYLYAILNRFLLTLSPKGIVIFEPRTGKVFGWNDQLKEILDMCVHKNIVYILHTDCTVTELQLLDAKDCLRTLYKQEEWLTLAQVACLKQDEILQNVESFLAIDFHEVVSQLKECIDIEDAGIIAQLESFIVPFEEKHAAVRAAVQEKLNQSLLESNNPNNEHGFYDTDDMKSNVSDGVSEGSSRRSLSMLTDVYLENIVQKATNVVVSKVINAGFMKKVFRETLHKEGVVLEGDSEPQNTKLIKHNIKPQSVPNSPRLNRTELYGAISDKEIDTPELNKKLPYRKSNSVPLLHTEPTKHQANPSNEDIVVHRRRAKKSRRKKKTTVVSIGSDDTKSIGSTQLIAETQSSYGSIRNLPSDETKGTGDSIMQKPTELDGVDGIEDIYAKFTLKLPENAPQLIHKLVNITAITRNKFRDPGVLYNPKSVQDALQSWATQLSLVITEFEEECFKTLEYSIQENMTNAILSYLQVESIKLLFTQFSAAFSEISNVAMLCLETGIFGKKCSFLKPHETALLNFDMSFEDITQKALKDIQKIRESHSVRSVDDKLVLETEKDTSPQISDEMKNIDDVTFDKHSLSTIASETELLSTFNVPIFDNEFHELKEDKILCENYNKETGCCEQCLVDKCRACFVLRYFPVLNFYRIQTLLSRHRNCRWRTWNACMTHLKRIHKDSKLLQSINTGNAPMVKTALKDDLNIEVFLSVTDRLVGKYPELLLQSVNSNILEPWEVALLYNTDLLPGHYREDFLQYASKVLSTSKDHPLGNLFLQCSLSNALLFKPDTESLYCECSKARPGSHTLHWKWNDLLLKLVDVVCNSSNQCGDELSVDTFLQLCHQNGYWTGYIELATRAKQTKDAIVLLYQLKDYNLLQHTISEDNLSVDDNTWISLLTEVDTISENKNHVCKPLSGWIPTLTFDKLIKIIAVSSGTRFVLNAMRQLKNAVVSKDLFSSLFAAAELENQQDAIVASLIEVASGNVWAENKRFLHAELEAIKQAELEGNEAPAVYPGSLLINDYVMDESDTVWGRSFDISGGECPVCLLPLCLKTTSTSSAGLIVFQCGHSFHKICLPEMACLVCYHDNFVALY